MKTLEDEVKVKNMEQETYLDINKLLTKDKKIIAFLGDRKSGTSFLINHMAEILSSKGVNVAILDTTQNKNSYYIYTKDEENLRRVAFSSIEDLAHGVATGVKVNHKLTVYTGLPGENKQIEQVEPILETLLKHHSLILIDCDFKTPIHYFGYAMEIYLVQTMDILTIQPLTEILSELKNTGMVKDSQIRVIINKYVELNSVAIKEIIGAMAFYNDPSMSYMKELFNKNLVKYITIPFEREIYRKYLDGLVNCNINLKEYPYDFMQILEQLSHEIYPFVVEG